MGWPPLLGWISRIRAMRMLIVPLAVHSFHRWGRFHLLRRQVFVTGVATARRRWAMNIHPPRSAVTSMMGYSAG